MKNWRKFFLSLAIVGVVLGFSGYGTYATFSAQTTNPGNVFANATMTMTNVAGTAVSGSNCSTSTSNGTCATIFSSATTAFKPGAADKTNTVTITYTGSYNTTSFGLYATTYTSKSGSSGASCTATNPGSKLNFQVKQGATIIYPTGGVGYGTLDGFATTYTNTGTLLALKGGTNGSGSTNVWATNDNSVFTININLDSTADNTYQACQSNADFVWYAA